MKRTRLNPVSKKRAKLNRQRRQVVAELSRDCYAKELMPEVNCGGELHPHELLPRGRGGSIVDPANIVMVCAVHHCMIHENPHWAHRVGLLKHSWD